MLAACSDSFDLDAFGLVATLVERCSHMLFSMSIYPECHQLECRLGIVHSSRPPSSTDYYIPKPFELVEMEAAVRRCLSGWWATRPLNSSKSCDTSGGRLLYVGLNTWIPADPQVGPCPP